MITKGCYGHIPEPGEATTLLTQRAKQSPGQCLKELLSMYTPGTSYAELESNSSALAFVSLENYNYFTVVQASSDYQMDAGQ